MLNKLRSRISVYNETVAKILSRTGVTPSAITFTALIITLFSIVPLIYLEDKVKYLLFISIILLAGYMDMLDGAIARYTGNVTRLGSFLDSTMDRITDVIIILYLYLGGLTTDNILLILLIATSLLISYVRAKAESLGINMQGIGLMERAERILLILLAIVLSKVLNIIEIEVVLWILVVLNSITILQRIIHVVSSLKIEKSASSHPSP